MIIADKIVVKYVVIDRHCFCLVALTDHNTFLPVKLTLSVIISDGQDCLAPTIMLTLAIAASPYPDHDLPES